MQPASETRTGGRARLLPAVGVGLLVVALVILWSREPFTSPQLSAPPPVAAASPSASHPTSSSGRRDAVAAAPMLAVPPLQDQPRSAATRAAEVLVVPPPTTVGPAGVPSGFPRTPAGAVAQLAAIETTVFNAMSLPHTAAVHRAWSWPGSADPDQWKLTGHVSAFLAAAGMKDALDGTATVTAAPAAGMVKGADGPDWVVACVLLEVHATISVPAQIGFGHCERLQWQPDPNGRPGSTGGWPGGRWLIGPGTPPAPAPSTWPGSELSRLAGWRTWAETTLDGQGG